MFATPPPVAVTPGLEQAFANTIVSTYPDGREARLWLEPDGRYRAEGRRHDPSSGHWSLKAEKLCLRQSRPIPVPFSWCTPRIATKIGAPWAGKAVTGEPIRIELRAGR